MIKKLLAHSADAGDRHRYAKDDQDNRKRGEQVVGSSGGNSLLDLDDQGVNRRHQHEPEGDVEELVALLKSKLDPGSYAKKVKSSNHLVSSAEDGPDSRPSCDFLELLDAVDEVGGERVADRVQTRATASTTISSVAWNLSTEPLVISWT